MINPDKVNGSKIIISFEVDTLVKTIIQDVLTIYEELESHDGFYDELWHFIKYGFLQYKCPDFLCQDSLPDMTAPPLNLPKSYFYETWGLLFKEGRTIYLWCLG